MPDFSNPVVLGEAAVLAAAVWAYFMLLGPILAKRAGVAMEEPPVWLYGAAFRGLSALSLIGALAAALYFPPQRDVVELLPERLVPLLLSLADVALVLGAVALVCAIHLRYKAQQEASVIEPLTGGEIAARVGAVVGVLAVLAAVPWAANSFLNVDLLAMLSGDASGGGHAANLPTVAAGAIVGILFWAIPETLARRKEIEGEGAESYRGSGLELFRWWLAGFVLFASLGIFGGLPGLEEVFAHPMSWGVGVGVPLAAGVVFLLFYALPLRKMGALAAGGDFVAREMMATTRALGIAGFVAYKKATRGRPTAFGADDEAKLCPTCLRPINDLSLYKDFKFDHCPHCASFIPPVFTMLDFVRHQAARLEPMLETDGPPGAIQKKKKQRGDDESQLVQGLLRALLAMAVQERGTDLHLVIESDRLLARCRTDGVLFTMAEFDKAMGRPLISATKVVANLDITERRKPQDGSFRIDIGTRSIDVRVNTSPVPEGETAAMRLLYSQGVLGSIDKMAASKRDLATLRRAIQSPSGLVLVTGPTGSGKSTTLYNCLETLSNGQKNIITLEDPIEHQIQGLTQMQINPSKGFTFATGLRTILRQDPDVIMVGEIRDSETARMAADAAATGHVVFSTLHSNDAIATLGRLKDLGIDGARVADVSLLFLAQRLMRLVCGKCGERVELTREELAAAGFDGAPRASYPVRKGRGCATCHESGYLGREGIYEFFVLQDEIKHMIVHNEPPAKIRARARQMGMRTLVENGLVKVLTGRSTIEELLRVTS